MARKHTNEEEDFDIEYVSKTEMKREMHSIQAFASEISLLPKKKRDQLPVSDELKDAFVVVDKIKDKPVAFKRHTQYMAKLLIDLDMEAIKAKVDFLNNKHQQQDKKNQALEELRDTLISKGDEEIQKVLEQHQSFDRQKLRQLVRQSKKEMAAEKAGKNCKALLQYLKDNINN